MLRLEKITTHRSLRAAYLSGPIVLMDEDRLGARAMS